MKKGYQLLMLVVLLLAARAGFAQQTSNPAILAGHFEMDTTIASMVRHINVNYSVSPAPFSSVAHVMLNTPKPVLFNIDLLNSSGTVVSSWSSPGAAAKCQHDFDISSLPSGNYHFNIRKYNTGAILHTVNFHK